MRAVHRRESKKDPQALDKLADKLVALGLEGDVAAMREIGDRLDGKPTQAIEHGGNVATRTVIRADVPAQSIEEWQQKYAQPEQPPLH
jgi:hypothetical protein